MAIAPTPLLHDHHLCITTVRMLTPTWTKNFQLRAMKRRTFPKLFTGRLHRGARRHCAVIDRKPGDGSEPSTLRRRVSDSPPGGGGRLLQRHPSTAISVIPAKVKRSGVVPHHLSRRISGKTLWVIPQVCEKRKGQNVLACGYCFADFVDNQHNNRKQHLNCHARNQLNHAHDHHNTTQAKTAIKLR